MIKNNLNVSSSTISNITAPLDLFNIWLFVQLGQPFSQHSSCILTTSSAFYHFSSTVTIFAAFMVSPTRDEALQQHQPLLLPSTSSLLRSPAILVTVGNRDQVEAKLCSSKWASLSISWDLFIPSYICFSSDSSPYHFTSFFYYLLQLQSTIVLFFLQVFLFYVCVTSSNFPRLHQPMKTTPISSPAFR